MTKKTAREALDAYYHEAGSWAEDRLDALRASRRVAWIVAGAFMAIAVFEALALIFLAPLKTVVPYTLLVDRHTGYVQELKPLDAQKIAPDTALTQSFLAQYVIARESYDATDVQENYRKVALWSADAARQGYIAHMQPSSADSPLTLYPRSTVVATRVKSISPLGGNAVLVRFDTQRQDRAAQPGPVQPWVAVVRYRFSAAPLSTEDRYVNPLGFQVMEYRRDAEAPTPPAPVAVPTAPVSETVTTNTTVVAGDPQ
jgi:type IV secretion system protein VirB8